MSEPPIVGYGRNFIKDYNTEEFKSSLKRAFKDNGADYIVLDSNPRGQKFLAASVAWAIDQKWLYNDQNRDDGQSEVSSFRLTDAGKKALGITIEEDANEDEKGCKRCRKQKKEGRTTPQFKKKHTTCFKCKKEVEQVLDLHHTNADLCSIECETDYWMDILY